jgi:hypothetical protein
MRTLRILLTALGALAVAGCGSMSEYDSPAYPTAPPPATVETAPATWPTESEEAAEPDSYVDEYEDTDPSAITDFKPSLDPYGTWVEDPVYGTVWVPSKTAVGEDFAPYVSAGHWAIDADENYVWQSDYDPTFGWVVFHYGRWVWSSPSSGWVWIPGRRYAPAWVVWRVGDPGYDYVGWAPMPPAFYWRSSTVFWLGYYPPAPYVFCSTRYVFHDHVHHHAVGRDHVAAVATQTHPYGSVPPPGNKHTLATPHRGPTPSSGHLPAKFWPDAKAPADTHHAAYTKPSGMGRAPMPSPSAPGASRRSTRSLGPSHVPSRSPGAAGGFPSHRAPSGHTAPGSPPPAYSPPSRGFAPPTQHGPPAHYAPPSRGPSPPSHVSPPSRAPSYSPRPSAPPSRVSPPPRPSRPSPPSHAAPSPPRRSSPTPSRPSPGRPGGGGKRR